MKTVASFAIDYTQYINPEGKLTTDSLPKLAKNYEKLIELYELMNLTRIFDTKAIALQRTGKLGTYASCLGHEAVHIGIGSAMQKEDVFAPMYREYGAQFYRGVKPSEVLLYWGGNEEGNNFSGPKHDFAWSVPIATQTLYAAGAALAFKLRNEPRVAVTVVGDGGSSKGDFNEAINAAGAWDLPIVFVIVNNQWAISVPRKQQSGSETLAQKGLAGGLGCQQVDGNDLVAVHKVMEKAITKARQGGGASVIEAITYRLSDHTTADDASRYREDAELEEAKAKEPFIRLRHYLIENNVWSDKKEQAMLEQCKATVEKEVETYLNTPTPSIASMFDYMYANMPPDLAQQKAFAMSGGN